MLLTSRVSVEMVQKAAVLAASILVAVSAPRALAVRVAQVCGMDACRDRARSGFRDLQPSAADCSGGAETSNGFFIEMLDCVVSDRAAPLYETHGCTDLGVEISFVGGRHSADRIGF